MKQSNKRTITFIICSIVTFNSRVDSSRKARSQPILRFSDICNSIFNYSETLELMLVRDVRIPRALCCIIYRRNFRSNRSYDSRCYKKSNSRTIILGVSQGATLVIAIFYAAGIAITTTNVMIASFIGAILTGIIVLGFISKKANNNSIAKILLAGTAMSTFFISLTTSNRTFIKSISNDRILGFWRI